MTEAALHRAVALTDRLRERLRAAALRPAVSLSRPDPGSDAARAAACEIARQILDMLEPARPARRR